MKIYQYTLITSLMLAFCALTAHASPPAYTEVSLNKPAVKWPWYNDAIMPASRGNDDVFYAQTGVYTDLMHTGSDPDAYWEVDLEGPHTVTTTEIWRRQQSQHYSQSENIKLLYLDRRGGVITTKIFGAGAYGTSDYLSWSGYGGTPVAGVYKVRVQRNTANYLVFEEVKVFARPEVPIVNAWQSSNWNSTFVAARAIDGNEGSLSHTQGFPRDWILFDLGRLVDISSVKIINRSGGYAYHLNGDVYFLKDNPKPVFNAIQDNLGASLADQNYIDAVSDAIERMREPYSAHVDQHNLEVTPSSKTSARYILLRQNTSGQNLHIGEIYVDGIPFEAEGRGAGGTAYQFNDNNARLYMTDSVDIGDHWSASARFQDLDLSGWDTLFGGAEGDHQVIVEGSTKRLGVYCNVTSCRNGQSSGFHFIDGLDMSLYDDNKPHTLTAVGSGTTTVFYIDGIQLGSVPVKSVTNITSVGNHLSGTQLFAKKLDHIQIHTVALTPDEIRRIARGDVVTRGLEAHYDAEGASSEWLNNKMMVGESVTATSVGTSTMAASTMSELYVDDVLPAGAAINGSGLLSGEWPWSRNLRYSALTYDDPAAPFYEVVEHFEAANGYDYFANPGTSGGIVQQWLTGLNYPVKRGDIFSAWIYMKPGSSPDGIQVQLKIGGGDWNHRTHWKTVSYSPSTQIVNTLPGEGQWTHVRVNLDTFGVREGENITGIAFSNLANGVVAWDNVHVGGGIYAQGKLLEQVWEDIDFEHGIKALLTNPAYPHNPTKIEESTDFTAIAGATGNPNSEGVGVRLSGYLTPPLTGTYKFRVSTGAGSQAALSLSDDEHAGNADFIVSNDGTATYEESASISLTAGKRYYIEAVMHDPSGNSYKLDVDWQGPGFGMGSISSQYLSLPTDRVDWLHCGVSHEICNLPDNVIVDVRFGRFDDYSIVKGYAGYDGTHDLVGRSFTCNISGFNAIGGDGDYVAGGKHCEYRVIRSAVTYHDDESVDVNFNVNIPKIYDGSGQNPSGYKFIRSDDGSQLVMNGNNWVQVGLNQNYVVTADTMLEFDLLSHDEGEVQGIGFAAPSDTSVAYIQSRTFQVHGDKPWGIDNYQYTAGVGNEQHFVINVGAHFTGTFNRLVFANDADPVSSDGSGHAVYANVKIYERNTDVGHTYLTSEGGNTYLDPGDIILGPNGAKAFMDGDGNLVLKDSSNNLKWSSLTSTSNLQLPLVKQSANHAHCILDDVSTPDVDESNCEPGHSLQVNSHSVHLVDRDGQIVWRPDLGDLNKVSGGLRVMIENDTSGHPMLVIRGHATDHRLWDSRHGYVPQLEKVAKALLTPTSVANERFYEQVPVIRTVAGNGGVPGTTSASALSYGTLSSTTVATTADGIAGSPFEFFPEREAAKTTDYVDWEHMERGILKTVTDWKDVRRTDSLYSDTFSDGDDVIVYRAQLTNQGQLQVVKLSLITTEYNKYNKNVNWLPSSSGSLGRLGHASYLQFNSHPETHVYSMSNAPTSSPLDTRGDASGIGDYYLIMTTKGFEVRDAKAQHGRLAHTVVWKVDASERAPYYDANGVGADAGIGNYLLSVNVNNARVELHQSDYYPQVIKKSTQFVYDYVVDAFKEGNQQQALFDNQNDVEQLTEFPASALAWHSKISHTQVYNTFIHNAEKDVINYVESRFQKLFVDAGKLGKDFFHDSRALWHDVRREGHALYQSVTVPNKSHLFAAIDGLGNVEKDMANMRTDLALDTLDVAVDAAEIGAMLASIVAPELIPGIVAAEKVLGYARAAVAAAEAFHEAYEVIRHVNSFGAIVNEILDENTLKAAYGNDYEAGFDDAFANNGLLESVNYLGEHTADIDHETTGKHLRTLAAPGEGPLNPPATTKSALHEWKEAGNCRSTCRHLTKHTLFGLDVAFDAVINAIKKHDTQPNNGIQEPANWQKRVALFGSKGTYDADGNDEDIKFRGNLSHLTIRPLLRFQPRLVKWPGESEFVKVRTAVVLKIQTIASRINFVRKKSAGMPLPNGNAPTGFGTLGQNLAQNFLSKGLLDSTDFIFYPKKLQQRGPATQVDSRKRVTDFVSYVGSVAWINPGWEIGPGQAIAFSVAQGIIGTFAALSAVPSDANAGLPASLALVGSSVLMSALSSTSSSHKYTDATVQVSNPDYVDNITTPDEDPTIPDQISYRGSFIDVEAVVGFGSFTRHRLTDLSPGQKAGIVLGHYSSYVGGAALIGLSWMVSRSVAPNNTFIADNKGWLSEISGIVFAYVENMISVLVPVVKLSNPDFSVSAWSPIGHFAYIAPLNAPYMLDSSNAPGKRASFVNRYFSPNAGGLAIIRFRSRTQFIHVLPYITRRGSGWSSYANWID
jgi:hypothetical protein